MTAFVAPQQGTYDNNNNTIPPHIFQDDCELAPSSAAVASSNGAAGDASSFDDLSFESLWSIHNAMPRQHQQQPHHQAQIFDQDAADSMQHLPPGLVDMTSKASMSAASSIGGSPATYTAVAAGGAAYPVSIPSAAEQSLPFDPTFGLSMPDGSLPDFGQVDGIGNTNNDDATAAMSSDRLSAFVGEYQTFSSPLSLDTAARFPSGPFSSSPRSGALQSLASPASAASLLSPDYASDGNSLDLKARDFSYVYRPSFSSQSPAFANAPAWFHPTGSGRQPQHVHAPQQASFSFDDSLQSLLFAQHAAQSVSWEHPYADRGLSSDPSLLQPTTATSGTHTPMAFPVHQHQQLHASSTSPSSSIASDGRISLKHAHSGDSSVSQPPLKKSRSNSPYLQTSSHSSWQGYPQAGDAHRSTSRSLHGPGSVHSDSSDVEDKDKEKGRCPFAECGKIFKDLKAHMLTHQTERPEKCPIPSCEYNRKGFSRKYDKNRHTLTHYKGTMICGFCPGSGSSAEKSFNRADVFKRHLTTVHHVEQSPPNSRKKQASSGKKAKGLAPGTTGKCSICSQIFQTPQDFYEHLEDCVLDVVQKVDPGEAINEAILASMADDKDTNDTIKRHAIDDESATLRDADGESDDEPDEHDFASKQSKDVVPSSSTAALHPNDAKAGSRGPGVTYSASGIPFHRQPRKRRKNYPNSWGCSADKMKMKKRVLAVFDGHNRLIKDDLMISSDFEVRMKLNLPSQPGQPGAGVEGDSGAYVTDLDVETLRRADGFFQASEDEKGPWKYTNVPGIETPQNFNVSADGVTPLC